jgi:hypothetical protein
MAPSFRLRVHAGPDRPPLRSQLRGRRHRAQAIPARIVASQFIRRSPYQPQSSRRLTFASHLEPARTQPLGAPRGRASPVGQWSSPPHLTRAAAWCFTPRSTRSPTCQVADIFIASSRNRQTVSKGKRRHAHELRIGMKKQKLESQCSKTFAARVSQRKLAYFGCSRLYSNVSAC